MKIAADAGITVKGVQVEVLNVLGAGDAFVSGFLRGWLNGEGYEQALRNVKACGALVVSRHGCPRPCQRVRSWIILLQTVMPFRAWN